MLMRFYAETARRVQINKSFSTSSKEFRYLLGNFRHTKRYDTRNVEAGINKLIFFLSNNQRENNFLTDISEADLAD